VDSLALRLPSGLAVRVSSGRGAAPVDDDRFSGARFFGARVYRALGTGALVVTTDDGTKLETANLDALRLPDYHALRDAAYRVGAVRQDAETLTCRNCDAEIRPTPEDAPIRDLDHWYTDAEPPRLGPFALSESGPEVTFRITTTGEARPFHEAVMKRTFRPTAAVVRAMGIVDFGGERSPRGIARALEALPDTEWAALEAAYETVAYSPKSYFPVVCPACGALHDMPAPAEREVDSRPYSEEVEPFLSEEDFAALVLTTGEAIYGEMGVAHIELEVVMDEAAVDGSGEPLLGSYQPVGETDPAGIAVAPFLISIYYRTFARMYEDEPYDVEAEIRETIEHEVQHHLHHLEGYDPMDEEERAEALSELERTYGKRAVQRARVTDVAADLRQLGWFAAGTIAVLGLIVLFLYLTGRL
jgi:hypothetical protein